MEDTSERGACLAQRLMSWTLLLAFLPLPFGFPAPFCRSLVMAMAKSLGKSDRQTIAWRIVDTSSSDTIAVDMRERLSAMALLMKHGTASAYFTVASDAVVMGNVYDHHARENLQHSSVHNEQLIAQTMHGFSWKQCIIAHPNPRKKLMRTTRDRYKKMAMKKNLRATASKLP
jgi:hypothetical protein